jgi:hypothetical protein
MSGLDYGLIAADVLKHAGLFCHGTESLAPMANALAVPQELLTRRLNQAGVCDELGIAYTALTYEHVIYAVMVIMLMAQAQQIFELKNKVKHLEIVLEKGPMLHA